MPSEFHQGICSKVKLLGHKIEGFLCVLNVGKLHIL